MRPLGIVSNSLCTLLSFLDWVLSHRQVMDYRFGRIRTMRVCFRRYRVSRSRRRVGGSNPSPESPSHIYQLLHMGLSNGWGIENWVEIEMTATSTRGIVTCSPTNEALVHGAAINGHYPVLDTALSMTDLAMWIEDHIQSAPNERNSLYSYDVYNMFFPHSRRVVETSTLGNQLYGNLDKWYSEGPPKVSILTDEHIRHEI